MKKENIKKAMIVTGKYLVTALIIVSTFFLGSFYEKWHKQNEIANETKEVKVKRDDVSLAIDEYNNLIIFNNNSGDYVIYGDSIGLDIFQLYAKNIWAEQNTVKN